MNSVSVVIVNWNSGDLLLKCLEGIRKQTVAPAEVIVVDNDSRDGSLNSIGFLSPNTTILKQKINGGFAMGCNVGIASAESGNWIALLNPDTYPEPEWLERLLEAARKNSDYSFFASQLIDANDQTRLDGEGDIYHVSGLAWRRHHHQPRDISLEVGEEIFAPCAAAALYKREALVDVGGFDENFFCYFEDVDLAFRLQLKGYRCLYVPSSRVAHVGSGITGKTSDFTLYHGHRNLVWTFVKNMPAPLLRRYLFQHLVLNLASIVRFLFLGRGRVILSAKWDALSRIRFFLIQRKKTQQNVASQVSRIDSLMKRGFFTPYLGRHG